MEYFHNSFQLALLPFLARGQTRFFHFNRPEFGRILSGYYKLIVSIPSPLILEIYFLDDLEMHKGLRVPDAFDPVQFFRDEFQ